LPPMINTKFRIFYECHHALRRFFKQIPLQVCLKPYTIFPMPIPNLKKLILSVLISSQIIFSPISLSAEVLFGKDYQQTLHKYLIQAKDSIIIAMYFIIIEPEGDGPVNELVNDLIAAKKRGVKVKVILEDSKLKESRLAYQKLKENNIPVYFDTPSNLLHIKGVAIDGRYLFLGSANWSRAAIEDNYEATYFKDSPPDARAFKKYVENIPFQDKDIFLPPIEGVTLSPDFLLSSKSRDSGLASNSQSHKYGRRLLKNQADKQFDLYLLLCKIAEARGENTFSIDYDSLAREMGYTVPENLRKYRSPHDYFYERIHRLLVRLRRYGLINYRKGIVTLKANNIRRSDKPSIVIPFEYWEFDYPAKLSMRAKYMYLVSLYEAARSTRYPYWFRSQKDMAKLYGISDTTISLGLLELEEKGIIEITRDKLTPPDFSDRKANVFKMLAPAL